ncbi:acyl-CoA dehydrogenase family protein [Tropicimonas sediminicola]|uniref:L-prolyl-[peptidyl carrier protein] dehydrogenase n=1 Tax=Tropicimonas sediminicola TaxID=1031541 RepID=A0A239LAJ6_9RHOB|nr:acyl-CoA dehydrogenase family protein [Tropicimonas sediminicola]SNT26938.1 L-prolyl-[peptidyl carrier protein] dehydrogenase [Tropicimonas sediminicola]
MPLTTEQIELRDAARDFAAANLGRDLEARDRRGAEDAEDWLGDWRKCAEYGFLSVQLPVEFGGRGMSVSSTAAMLEGLGMGCADNGLTLAVNGQVWAVTEAIKTFATDEQARRWLPGLGDGSLIGADGMTERDSGSDAFALETTAERVDGGYVLNGEKILIGLAPRCDIALVFASTDPAAGRWGVSAFIVEAGDEGFERGLPASKMGLRTAPLGGLTLNNCFVPEDRLLGGEGDGGAIFQHSVEWERCFIFASHVGSMARQLEQCVDFAGRRKVFGTAIANHQSVGNRLADMRLRLETSRLMLYHAAEMKDRGEPCTMTAAMTKLHISEAFVANSTDALRIHGGAGYMTETGVERDLRDALGGVIYGGTSDIQRQVISAILMGGRA